MAIRTQELQVLYRVVQRIAIHVIHFKCDWLVIVVADATLAASVSFDVDQDLSLPRARLESHQLAKVPPFNKVSGQLGSTMSLLASIRAESLIRCLLQTELAFHSSIVTQLAVMVGFEPTGLLSESSSLAGKCNKPDSTTSPCLVLI